MTGGRVVVLGPTGRNFGAGMSGGIAYLLDAVPARVNTQLAEVEPLDGSDEETVLALLREHVERTGSTVAAALLADWSRDRFLRVLPHDYRRALHTPLSAGGIGFVTRETEAA
jgi:glutamate synthase (NADPH/NADH) large chain